MHIKMLQFMVAIGIIHTALSSLLTAEETQLVLCGLTVLHRHFNAKTNLLVSFSHTTYNNTQQRTLSHTSQYKNYHYLLNALLQNIHDAARWAILVPNPDQPSLETMDEVQGKMDYYLVIVRPKGTDEETFDEVQDRFDSLPKMESWNQRALFLVMLTGTIKEPKLLAHKIFDVLWKSEKVLNIVLIVPTVQESVLHDNVRHTEKSISFDLYTWFPYQSGHCGAVEEITLVDQWIVTNNGGFLKHVPLFPNKVPANLQACPLRVCTAEDRPFIVHNIQNENSSEFSGLEIEFLIIISQVMNMTLQYLPPPTGTGFMRRMTCLTRLSFGSTDIVVSTLPVDLNIIELGDSTTPHLQTAFRWLIPCPTPVPRVERILGIFTLPVWLNLILVLTLTTAIFWCFSNRHFTFLKQGSPTHKTLSQSLSDVWAVFLSVSIPKLPGARKFRVFFLLFVWYSFAINIVFQAFFVTFLVEPGYSKEIKTFEDLIQSGLMYGYHPETEIFLNLSMYYEQTKIRSPRFYCPDHDECVKRLITHGDITMVSVPLSAEYIASKIIPSYKKRKQVCYLIEDIYKMNLAMYMQQGNPLIYRANTIIRRTIEAGLIDNYWSMVKWSIRVKNMANSTYDAGLTDDNEYFALTFSHLKIAFVMLLVGYILGSIVLIAELLHALISTRQSKRK
jgi:hypothetical protein